MSSIDSETAYTTHINQLSISRNLTDVERTLAMVRLNYPGWLTEVEFDNLLLFASKAKAKFRAESDAKASAKAARDAKIRAICMKFSTRSAKHLAELAAEEIIQLLDEESEH